MPQVTSDFAVLDVKNGREAVKRMVDTGKRIPVVIHGFIEDVWGNDDGVSREFGVGVVRLEFPEDR